MLLSLLPGHHALRVHEAHVAALGGWDARRQVDGVVALLQRLAERAGAAVGGHTVVAIDLLVDSGDGAQNHVVGI